MALAVSLSPSISWSGDFDACNDPNGGACEKPSTGPGCSDPVCCNRVCDVDPFCCFVQWDSVCVNIGECQCSDWTYVCESDDGGPSNDCYVNPLPIADGDEIEFTTLFADTDGPSTSFCDALPGDDQLWNDVWYLFRAESQGSLTVSCCETVAFSAKIGIYSGGEIGDPIEPGFFPVSCATFNPLVCRDECPNGDEQGAEVTFEVDPGSQYLVRLGSSGQETGLGKMRVFFDYVECPGDFDGSRKVDGQDIGLFFVEWGECSGCIADLDQSGVVDGEDFGILLTYWGECP